MKNRNLPAAARTPRALRQSSSVSVAQSRCSLFVTGLDLNCPLCAVLVRSGEMHTCKGKPLATGRSH